MSLRRTRMAMSALAVLVVSLVGFAVDETGAVVPVRAAVLAVPLVIAIALRSREIDYVAAGGPAR